MSGAGSLLGRSINKGGGGRGATERKGLGLSSRKVPCSHSWLTINPLPCPGQILAWVRISLRNPEDQRVFPVCVCLSSQQSVRSVSPCQLQPQVRSWLALTLFSPSSLALAPSSHPLPAVPSPWHCQLSSWRDTCQGPGSRRDSRENWELVSLSSGSRPLEIYASPQDAQVCLGVGGGEGSCCQSPIFLQEHSVLVVLTVDLADGSLFWPSEIRPLCQRPCQSISNSSDLIS